MVCLKLEIFDRDAPQVIHRRSTWWICWRNEGRMEQIYSPRVPARQVGEHEFCARIFSRFTIARLLTLSFLGLTQRLFLTLNQFRILLANIVYVHGEFVKNADIITQQSTLNATLVSTM